MSDLWEKCTIEDRKNLIGLATDEKLVEWGLCMPGSSFAETSQYVAAELARRLAERLKPSTEPENHRCDHAKRKAWFHIRGGKKLYYEDPQPQDMPVLELIQAIACERRFANQIKTRYNVANHSVLVYNILKSWNTPKRALVQGLIHDLHEGVTRDVSSPLAHNPDMAYFRKVCDGLLKANCERAGVPFPLEPIVHKADKAACKLEAQAFVDDRHPDWCEYLDDYPDADGFDPWSYLEDEDRSVEVFLESLQEATCGVGSPEFHAEVDGWFKMALRDEIL